MVESNDYPPMPLGMRNGLTAIQDEVFKLAFLAFTHQPRASYTTDIGEFPIEGLPTDEAFQDSMLGLSCLFYDSNIHLLSFIALVLADFSYTLGDYKEDCYRIGAMQSQGWLAGLQRSFDSIVLDFETSGLHQCPVSSGVPYMMSYVSGTWESGAGMFPMACLTEAPCGACASLSEAVAELKILHNLIGELVEREHEREANIGYFDPDAQLL